MEMKKSLFNKILSCFIVMVMVLTTIFAMPTMNTEAATKKAAMSKTSVTLIVNKTCTLSVNNAKGKATWSTSDKKVATVSKTGDRSAKITAKKTGTATITAKIGSKKYTCKVKVENPKLSATSKTLNTKDAKTATIQLNSTSQGSSVKWSTSNSKIVSIKASKNKVTMTAKKAGSATVTATVGGKKFSCKVTVEKSHNYKKGKTVAATCSKKGYTEYKCACGKSYKKAINATGKHSYTVKKNTVAATCTKDGYTVYKCKTCDKTTKKTIKATGHKYGEWEVTEPASSEHDGWEERKCQTCGETESREIHNWGEWEKTDPSCETEGSYSRVCTNCYEYESTPIPATGHTYNYDGEKEGYKWVEETEEFDKDIEIQTTLYTCSVCGASSTDQEIMEHHVDKHYDVADARLIESTTTETKHLVAKASGHYEKVECGVGGEKLYVCSQCGDTYTESISAPEAHKYGDGVVTTPATCTEEGEMTYTCTVCGHEEVKKIPTLDHNYESKTTTEVVETAENGDKITQTTTERICSNCGEAEHKEHVWNEWTITKEPTTTEMGSKTRTCSECGATQTMDIARVAEPEHNEHTWGDWTVTEEATCTAEGMKTRTCTVCGETDTQTIPAIGHNYETKTTTEVVETAENGDKITQTTAEKICSNCGEAEHKEHTWSDWTITKEPTTTEMGSKTRTCADCGATQTMDIARVAEPDKPEHTEHVWSDWTVTKEANCKEEGERSRECTVCGEKVTEKIAKTTNHNFGDWVTTTPATCKAEGVKTRTCTICGETETASIPKTDHDYETKIVVDKEAWDEKVADHTVYICKGCKGEFDSIEAFEAHVAELEEKYNDDYDKIMENHGPVNNSTRVEYKTVHHDAVTHEEHVCKVCGHVKED